MKGDYIMKKVIVFMLTAFLLLSIFSGCKNASEVAPETIPEEMYDDISLIDSPATDFYYEERDNNGITIIDYKGTDEHVVIPSKINNIPVTVIGTNAFKDAVNLKSIVIPESVTTIDETGFIDCTNLTRFVVKEGNQNYSSHNGVLYNEDKSQIVLFPIGKQDAYIIPNCVKSIREYAFLAVHIWKVSPSRLVLKVLATEPLTPAQVLSILM